jgi:release factor glutamine methyltransferase
MRPAEVLRRAADYLGRHGVESPLPEAERMLAAVLAVDRASLYTRAEGLSASEARAFGKLLCRRCSGAPLQHVTGEQGFRRLTLEVRPGVFVPRPETEVVVEAALATISATRSPLAVDVGTGTGAIALALKHERPDATVLATDRSVAAVTLARDNARRLGLDVRVFLGDLLDPLPGAARGRVDVVASNPPYIEADELDGLPADVLADPPDALVGGTRAAMRVLREARDWLRSGGGAAIEIGERQGLALSDGARELGYVDVAVLPDLAGRDRVLVARRS